MAPEVVFKARKGITSISALRNALNSTGILDVKTINFNGGEMRETCDPYSFFFNGIQKEK